MPLESTTTIAGLVRTNPAASDPKSEGDDHIRQLKAVVQDAFTGFSGAVLVTGVDGGAVNAYTLTPATALIGYSTKMLIEFTPTATNTTTTPTLNISGLGAKTIVSVANAALLTGDLVAGTPVLATYDGTNVRLLGPTKNWVDQLILSAALPAQALGWLRSDGATNSFTQTHTGYAQNEVKGADIASAATINLTTATGNLVHVTGTTTITAITIPVGADRTVIFDGVLTLTHSAALLLPGASNILTAANDRMVVRGDTAGAIVTSYTKAAGAAFPYLHVREEQASGTAGGTSTSATYHVRTLNTTVGANSIIGASLASNIVTLPAGTYEVVASAPAAAAGVHKLSLYNDSDAVDILVGSNAAGPTPTGVQTHSLCQGRFTLAATKNVKLRHYIGNGLASSGLGAAVSSGQVEVYASLQLWRV